MREEGGTCTERGSGDEDADGAVLKSRFDDIPFFPS
jgi:hypothetical protein